MRKDSLRVEAYGAVDELNDDGRAAVTATPDRLVSRRLITIGP